MNNQLTSTLNEHKQKSDSIIFELKARVSIHENTDSQKSSIKTKITSVNNDELESNSDEEFVRDEQREETKAKSKNESKTKKSKTVKSKTLDTNFSIYVILSSAALLVLVIFGGTYLQSEDSHNNRDEKFDQLQSKYSNVNPIIFFEVEGAVDLILRKGLPLSIVFAHYSDEDSTILTLTLIKDLAQLASQYLGNGSTFTISPDNLDVEDYGELLTRWRPDIEQGRTVVVTNLHKMPAHLAAVFHALCDEVTPFVRSTLYLHTIDLGKNALQIQPINNETGLRYFTAVQNRLRQSWPNMADEVFDPLLSRIAGSIFILD